MKFRKPELKRFIWWMNERYNIYAQRKKGYPQPWTRDKILRTYKFTNVYRQTDRVTQEWTDRFCRLLHRGKDMTDGDLLFHIVMFRIFNWPQTYDKLFFHMRKEWNSKLAVKLLDEMKADKQQIFTGAYIVTSGGKRDPKHHTIIAALDECWKNRDDMAVQIRAYKTMEGAVEILQDIPTIGPFVAYEMACDMRHTRLLQHARDVQSWANPGPGAKRGIHRLLFGTKDRRLPLKQSDYVRAMRELYVLITTEKSYPVDPEWPFEMREIEHSLCEFDKYERVRKGEGRPRSKFVARKEPKKLPPYLEKY